MRETNFDIVLGLYIESISGELSPEDQAMLERKLLDPDFRKLWQELQEQGKEICIDSFLQNLDPQKDLESLRQLIDKTDKTADSIGTEDAGSSPMSVITDNSFQGKGFNNKAQSSRNKMAAVVLLLILMGAAGYLIFVKNKKITGNQEIAIKVHQHIADVELLLGDGKTVSLPKENIPQVIKVGASTLNLQGGSLQFKSNDPTLNTLSVPEGQTYKIVLSDGTIVQMNAASKLRFPFRFNGENREVFMEGEAYFEVAKNPKHPFIVHTSLTDIKVLGTHFNINAYNGSNVVTSLLEGKVETADSAGRRTLLSPGQAATYSIDGGFIKEPFDSDDVLSWIKGVYYFHNVPIIDLVNVISRCYGVKVVLENPHKFSHTSITGIMKKDNLSELLNDLRTTAGIRYFYSDNRLYLQ